MPELTGIQKAALVKMLEEYFPLRGDFERAIVDLERKCQSKALNRSNDFSISRWIRGMMAAQHVPALRGTNPEEDLNYFQNHNNEMKRTNRDLSTSSVPGQYLVPTIASADIVALLSDYGTLRRAGVRIVPMIGIEKLTMPSALAYPTVAWLGENTAQSSSDANLGQVSFDLKTMRSLTPIPNELVSVSTPAIEELISSLLAAGFGEAEDKAFFSTATVTNAPASLYSQVGSLTTLLANGNSANGGALTYSDLLATLAKSRNAKARGPFAWFCNPTVLYNSISGILDKNSRPIFDPNQIVQRLFGWPVYDTTWINADQSNGSGSNQSFMVLANPSYFMIGEPGTLEVAVSTEFYFDKNQIAIRGVKREDWAIAPPLGVTVLKGIA
jgi:HK97 family phage major capsid protein